MSTKNRRFSKALLAEYIAKHAFRFDFNPRDGWNQVNGKGEEANRNYGEFRALLDLANEFELDLEEGYLRVTQESKGSR